MPEVLTLTLPIATPSITSYRVSRLVLDLPAKQLWIALLDNNDQDHGYSYEGDPAVTLMNALNTANLSVKSLQRRILEKLAADGLLVGTIGGTP